MKLKILNKSDRKLSFILEEVDYGFANALRRVMMNEVPTLSIEFVDFVDNSSGLYDEIIAHMRGPLNPTEVIIYGQSYTLSSHKRVLRVQPNRPAGLPYPQPYAHHQPNQREDYHRLAEHGCWIQSR